MSYIDSRPPLMPQQHQYIPGSDAIGVRPQVQANGNEHPESSSEYDHQLPLKRPRIFDDASSNSQCISVPANRWTANILFKSRLCSKFKLGACRNGENRNFAHGMQDRRQPPYSWQELVGVSVCSEEDMPPGNWDDDQMIIHMMKLCKKYYNGEECPYGDRCSFLHEDPRRFPGRALPLVLVLQGLEWDMGAMVLLVMLTGPGTTLLLMLLEQT